MRGGSNRNPSTFTRAVNSVFAFVRYAEFEILFVLFFLIAFIIFKDLQLSKPFFLFLPTKKPSQLKSNHFTEEFITHCTSNKAKINCHKMRAFK
ncbi:hypothetical protein PVL29_024202 [Vitis rotundifolia]|uniref:Uncharacterized protein n=1 Tax=Vitis rotundifolia TaxID=103349 RepID=A0AA38YR92_VITRO|nr:hypothetical protein PVL29_024202 [Vitis rotundifolia]